MRILHVAPSYLPAYRYGGPIISVHNLCKALVALEHEVHVFTTNVDGDRDSDVPLERPVDIDGVKIWYFPSKRLRRLYWSPPMGKALSHEVKKCDLLHLHSVFLWPTSAAARTARKNNVPYIISPRGMLVKDLVRRKSRVVKTAWIQLIEKNNLERSAALHMTSQIEAGEAARFGFRLSPLFVIPNGVDIQPGNTDTNISDTVRRIIGGKPFILFLGRVNWEKGLDRLIPALSYVSYVHLVIAGNDEENYRPTLESLTERCRVKERVTFTGPVHGSDKVALLKQASMLVLPSYSENFGNVIMEAMAVGCPVVVTPEVGAAEIVVSTGAGLVLNGAPEVLGKGINELLLKSQLLKEMGERGKKAIAEQYTWPAIAKQMEHAYLNILKTPREAAP